MNALLPVFLVLVLFGGEKTRSVTELLSRIDFASFRPVFNLLGVNGKTVDFLCSEEFSRAVDGNLDAAALMKLVSDLAAKPERNEKADDESKNSSSAEVANKLSPIENVVPSEIENSLTSYFG